MWKRVWFIHNREINQGNFVTWGTDTHGSSQAIITMDNGKVVMVFPSDVQFQEPGQKCVLEVNYENC